MMAEGISLRAISRLTAVNKNTLAKLLEDVGRAFREYHGQELGAPGTLPVR